MSWITEHKKPLLIGGSVLVVAAGGLWIYKAHEASSGVGSSLGSSVGVPTYGGLGLPAALSQPPISTADTPSDIPVGSAQGNGGGAGGGGSGGTGTSTPSSTPSSGGTVAPASNPSSSPASQTVQPPVGSAVSPGAFAATLVTPITPVAGLTQQQTDAAVGSAVGQAVPAITGAANAVTNALSFQDELPAYLNPAAVHTKDGVTYYGVRANDGTEAQHGGYKLIQGSKLGTGFTPGALYAYK